MAAEFTSEWKGWPGGQAPPAAGQREERAGHAGGRSSLVAGHALLHGTEGGRPMPGGVEEGRRGREDSRRRGSRVGAGDGGLDWLGAPQRNGGGPAAVRNPNRHAR